MSKRGTYLHIFLFIKLTSHSEYYSTIALFIFLKLQHKFCDVRFTPVWSRYPVFRPNTFYIRINCTKIVTFNFWSTMFLLSFNFGSLPFIILAQTVKFISFHDTDKF
jgi:hypothetical protein